MNVTFEEEQTLAPTVSRSTQVRGLYALVIRWGLAKDEREASIALIIIAALAGLLAVTVWFVAGGFEPEGTTHKELIQMQRREGV